MNGSIKIIGTNDITKHLQDKVFEDCHLINEGKLHLLYLSDEKYLLDIKKVDFDTKFLLVFGIISDDATYAGNIALKFYPENNIDLDQKIN